MNYKSFLYLTLFWVLIGCDIIQAPYLEPEALPQLAADEQCLIDAQAVDPFGPSAPAVVKKVLLEEMTGHKCGNCPAASEKAIALKNTNFPGRVILVTIHAGPLATVNASGKYATEFRTSEGNELYKELNPFDAVPFGLIDRNESGLGAATWQTKIENRLQAAVEAGISIFNCYNPDSLELTTVIDIKYFEDASEQEFLSVYLVEDQIKDWQKDYRLSESDIQEYTHHDVFRDAINGAWGEPLKSTEVKNGERFTKSYTYRINPAFNVANCKIVAFVHNRKSKLVRQVEEAPIVQ